MNWIFCWEKNEFVFVFCLPMILFFVWIFSFPFHSCFFLSFCKLGFAFSFHDAQQPIDKVLPHHRARSIAKLPSLLEYFGFVYFFCGFSTGPVFDYREYEEFISLQMFQDEVWFQERNEEKMKDNEMKELKIEKWMNEWEKREREDNWMSIFFFFIIFFFFFLFSFND